MTRYYLLLMTLSVVDILGLGAAALLLAELLLTDILISLLICAEPLRTSTDANQ